MKHLQSTITDPETGEVICNCCGRVVETLQESPQGRKAITPEEKAERVQHSKSNKYRHDLGLHTEINTKDHTGRPVGYDITGLHKWNKRIITSSPKERRLYAALQKHAEITAFLGIPRPVTETSIEILRKAIKNTSRKNHAKKYLIVACIYWAYKQRGISLDVKKMVKNMKIKSRSLRKYSMMLEEDLNLKETNQTKDEILVGIYKIANTLQLSQKITLQATTILGMARKIIPMGIAGKSYLGLASAILYLLVKRQNQYDRRLGIYQEEIAEAAGITVVTLRNHAKLFEPVWDKFEEMESFKAQIRAARK